MNYVSLATLILTLAAGCNVRAQEVDAGMALDASSLDNNVATVYSEACEKIKKDEPKSSIRMRVTDKASFNAVSNMSELASLKKKLDPHHFNVLVYNIVDNYVEDLAVRTISHNSDNLCMEMTGYVRKENISKAYEEAKNAPNNTDEVKGLNEEDLIDEMDEEPQVEETTSSEGPTSLLPVPEEESVEAPISNDKAKLLYVEPVEFFNNTKSEKHSQILKDIFAKNENFYLTDKEELADYIIKSKILRAKVDPINSNTNRLQMVLAVGVKFTDTNASSVEHQNRFILFSSGEDEQKTAADLMKKLFAKAAEPILSKVEKDARQKNGNNSLPKIITPNKF